MIVVSSRYPLFGTELNHEKQESFLIPFRILDRKNWLKSKFLTRLVFTGLSGLYPTCSRNINEQELELAFDLNARMGFRTISTTQIFLFTRLTISFLKANFMPDRVNCERIEIKNEQEIEEIWLKSIANKENRKKLSSCKALQWNAVPNCSCEAYNR